MTKRKNAPKQSPGKKPRPEVLAAAESAKVIGIGEAARIHEIPYSTLNGYINAHEISTPPNPCKDNLNLELSVLCVVAENECPKSPISLNIIADVCGVSKQAISMIEQRALKKLRNNPEIKSMIEHLLK